MTRIIYTLLAVTMIGCTNQISSQSEVPNRMEIFPNSISLYEGDIARVEVKVYSDNNEITFDPSKMLWQYDSRYFIVDRQGNLIGIEATSSSATLRPIYENIYNSPSIEINVLNPLVNLYITSPSDTLFVGDEVTLNVVPVLAKENLPFNKPVKLAIFE
jgi:hypothetical protein